MPAIAFGDAVVAALSPKLQVIDLAGTVVGEGTAGGEPIEVDVGTYTVKVLTSPVQTFEVEVQSGQAVKLTLDEKE